MSGYVLAGNHGVTQKSYNGSFGRFLKEFFPGYGLDAEYNFIEKATTQAAAQQLNIGMQDSNHPWIDAALAQIEKDIRAVYVDANGNPVSANDSNVDLVKTKAERVKLTVGAVNFLLESNDANNLHPDGRTGGVYCYTSRSDADAIIKFEGRPTKGDLETLFKEQYSLANMRGTAAFDDGYNANARIVDGRTVWDTPVENGGRGPLSKPWQAMYPRTDYPAFDGPRWELDSSLGGAKKYGSSDFAAAANAKYNVEFVFSQDKKNTGYVKIKGTDTVIDYERVKAVLETKVDGVEIQSHKFHLIPKSLLDALGNSIKVGAGGLALVGVFTTAVSAAEAQSDLNYDPAAASDTNRAFVGELTSVVIGELLGKVVTLLIPAGKFAGLTLPAKFLVMQLMDSVARGVGHDYYDQDTAGGNLLAENLAPFFADLAALSPDEIAELADGIAAQLISVVSGMMNQIEDVLFGEKGLFGIDGPLFGEGGPLYPARQIFEKFGGEADWDGNWIIEGLDAIAEGTDGDDTMAHDGWGELRGGKGNDILVGLEPVFIKKGDQLFDGGNVVADKDLYMVLDGGEGNDWIATFLGTGALTIGGIGRDMIINSSKGGVIYGDTIDGLYHGQHGTVEINSEVREDRYGEVAEATADNFWFFPNVTIMDPGHNDILTFFGFPLVGGGAVADLTTADMSVLMMGEAPKPSTRQRAVTQGKVVLHLDGLRTMDRSGLKPISIDGVSLRSGEILGVAGVSGNGQMELMEILTGQRHLTDGKIMLNGVPYTASRTQAKQHKVRYLPEEPLRNACAPRMSVAENLAFRIFDENGEAKPAFWKSNSAIARNAATLISAFNVKTSSPAARISSLSGGNVQRAVLARELTGDVEVLIVSNPCFGLDFSAVSAIRDRLVEARNRGVAILLISEDLDEIMELSDRIIVMSQGHVAYETPIATANVAEIGYYMAGHA